MIEYNVSPSPSPTEQTNQNPFSSCMTNETDEFKECQKHSALHVICVRSVIVCCDEEPNKCSASPYPHKQEERKQSNQREEFGIGINPRL